ncbi:MAG: glycosyltransferase family 4 protein [Geminicoccaceae bacterium]
MKIALIAPLIESVPPRLYGGTERIVSYLAEELVRQGHAVTLFASGDSLTSAELVPCAPRALRLDPTMRDPLPYYMVMLDRVRRRAHEFDALHFHIDYLHFPLFRELAARTLTTQHGRLDLPDLPVAYKVFHEYPLVSISNHQRQPCPDWHWVRTVHHGLPDHLCGFSPQAADGYLAFLGRICPEKRPDRAIEIARRAGLDLKIAAKVDPVDQRYFDEVIRPLLRHPGIEFIGEIGDHEKTAFLSGARALLFPIDWPEPFGLVMIEAMASGTPVIAWRCGSVPEVIEDGLTGFLVGDIESAVAAVHDLDRLDRAAIRARFAQRFTVRRMAEDYLAIYASSTSRFELPISRPMLAAGIGQPGLGGNGPIEPATAA